MERVLKLNQSYEPIGIINWQEAIKLIFLGKAEVVKEYDKKLHSAKNVFNMPAVVRLYNSFRRPKQRIKFNRKNVIMRDKRRCQYCGRKFESSELTYDHVIPRSRGGKTEFENIVTCCIPCNAKKGDKLLHEIGFKLHKKPVKPDWIPIFSITLSGNNIPEIWRDFCYF
jgi:5-methylcytosine-specific restriction endonuclease McrA